MESPGRKARGDTEDMKVGCIFLSNLGQHNALCIISDAYKGHFRFSLFFIISIMCLLY